MAPNYAGALSQHQQHQQHGHGRGRGKGTGGGNVSDTVSQAPLTPTAMGRWSVASKQLPSVDQIKFLHVYDFDNTREPNPTRDSCWPSVSSYLSHSR